jgi:hypothetical protein
MDGVKWAARSRPPAWQRLARLLALARTHVGELSLKAIASLWPPNAVMIARHAAGVLGRGEPRAPVATLDSSIDDALAWLCWSQDRVGSGGIGCYDFYRWTRGYPEVTGYIIPTFWDCARALGREDLGGRAVRMADWELRVQRPEGAFEGGYEGDGKPPVVFNTGQVIRGLLRSASETGDVRYRDAAVRAGDWIVANQDADGSWTTANYKGMKRVYDSYVAAPLAQLAQVTGDGTYAEAAIRNCDFVLGRQRPNGWFELCDNNPRFNDAPLTHTIGYTVDGLLETGELLGEDRYVAAATIAADSLLEVVGASPQLPARLDERWQARARYVCVTGAAQLGVILMKLRLRTGEERYGDGARALVEFLAGVQRRGGVGRNHRGALPGSYPVWGLYSPFKLPSWATKYMLDLLLLVHVSGRASDGTTSATAARTATG